MNQPDREEALKMARDAVTDWQVESVADVILEARALEAERAAEHATRQGFFHGREQYLERAAKLREQKQP